MGSRLVDRSDYFDGMLRGMGDRPDRTGRALTAVDMFLTQGMDEKEREEPGIRAMHDYIACVFNIPGYQLSHFQEMLHEAALSVYAPNIMRGCTSDQQADVLRQYGIAVTETRYLQGETGRRAGKTDVVTQIPAALLASVPYATICFYSLYMHTCKSACDTVYKWLVLMGFSDKVKKTTFCIKFFAADGDVRVLHFFSGQSENVNLYLYIFVCYFPGGVITS